MCPVNPVPFALALAFLAQAPEAAIARHLADLSAAEPGFALGDDDRLDEAREFFRDLVGRAPKSSAARVGLARAQVRKGLARAHEAQPGEPALLAALVDALPLAPPDPDSASPGVPKREALLDELERLDPHNPFAALARARTALGRRADGYRIETDRGFTVTLRTRTEDAATATARRHLAPFLVPQPGSLLLWHVFLEDISPGGEEDRAAAERAVDADPKSPLAPRVRMDLALALTSGPERFAALARIETENPDSPYWDDARVARANLLPSGRDSEAAALLEPLLARERGNAVNPGLHSLTEIQLRLERPADALRTADRLKERGSADEDAAVRALLALGRLDEAEARCRRRIAELEAAQQPDQDPPYGIHEAHWRLGEVVLAAGRPREAVDQFDGVLRDARPGEYGPWWEPGAWSKTTRALVLAFPFPIAASALHLFVLALTFTLAGIAVAAQPQRVRRFLPPVLLLAALASALQVASASCTGSAAGTDIAWLLLVMTHNTLLAGAGSLLLPAVGIKHGPWARLVLRGGARRPSRWAPCLLRLLLAVALMAGWTALCIWLAEPRVGPFFERMSRLFRGSEFSILLGLDGDRMSAAILAVTAAVREELVFRFVLLGIFLWAARRVLGRGTAARARAAPVAVLAVGLVWAVIHAGMVEPEWFKIVQVTGIGAVLGWLTLRQGAGSAVIAHVAFNLTAVLSG